MPTDPLTTHIANTPAIPQAEGAAAADAAAADAAAADAAAADAAAADAAAADAAAQEILLPQVLASFRAAAPIFQALGDTFRQDIVMLLAQQDRLNVNQITEQIALSRPAVSHHLKVLLQAGLVRMERVSRENFYSLSVDDGLLVLRQLVEQAELSCT